MRKHKSNHPPAGPSGASSAKRSGPSTSHTLKEGRSSPALFLKIMTHTGHRKTSVSRALHGPFALGEVGLCSTAV